MTRRAVTTGHGPSARERAIIDRADAGMGFKEIAAELGIKPSYVHQVLCRLSGSWDENLRFERMVREGSRRLAEAVAATGKRFS